MKFCSLLSSYQQHTPNFWSQNNRTGKVWMDHSGHLARPPCSSTSWSTLHRNCILTVLEYLQWGRLHSLSGQPLPVLNHLKSKEVFPHVQMKLPVHQFLSIATCLIVWHCQEELGSIVLTPYILIPSLGNHHCSAGHEKSLVLTYKNSSWMLMATFPNEVSSLSFFVYS